MAEGQAPAQTAVKQKNWTLAVPPARSPSGAEGRTTSERGRGSFLLDLPASQATIPKDLFTDRGTKLTGPAGGVPWPLPSPPPVWRVVLAGGDDPGMQLELSGVEVRGESWSERCRCTIENASAYVVTVITVIESRSLSLVSAYVADLSGRTAVTHMRLAPDRAASFEQQVLGGFPGVSHPRACLLDHAAELRALVEELVEEPVVVEIPEASLEHASTVWGAPPRPDRPIARGPVRAPAAAGGGIGPPRARRLTAARPARSGTPRPGWRAPDRPAPSMPVSVRAAGSAHGGR